MIAIENVIRSCRALIDTFRPAHKKEILPWAHSIIIDPTTRSFPPSR